jgi:TRAP-type C4-dicarboxylate transport system substrate-binding protein
MAQPFVEAVNAEGKDLVKVVVYSGGTLGREIADQPQAVIDGRADIAVVIPGYTPERFANSVIELPGLFQDLREGTLVYTRLIELEALDGYDDFVVLGAYVSTPETIHSRLPIGSIDDLNGMRIRTNNQGQAAALENLGALPIPMPIITIAEAFSAGTIDAASVAVMPLSDFGIKRLATHHYFLGTSGAPLALLMNRGKFESLPAAVQDIIRKYSGEWAARHFIEIAGRTDDEGIAQLASDPKRTLVYPSRSDLDRAQDAFRSVIEAWQKMNADNAALLATTRSALAALRATR